MLFADGVAYGRPGCTQPGRRTEGVNFSAPPTFEMATSAPPTASPLSLTASRLAYLDATSPQSVEEGRCHAATTKDECLSHYRCDWRSAGQDKYCETRVDFVSCSAIEKKGQCLSQSDRCVWKNRSGKKFCATKPVRIVKAADTLDESSDVEA